MGNDDYPAQLYYADNRVVDLYISSQQAVSDPATKIIDEKKKKNPYGAADCDGRRRYHAVGT